MLSSIRCCHRSIAGHLNAECTIESSAYAWRWGRNWSSLKLSRLACWLCRASYPHGNPNFAKSIATTLHGWEASASCSSISFVPESRYYRRGNLWVVTTEWFVFLRLRPTASLPLLRSFILPSVTASIHERNKKVLRPAVKNVAESTLLQRIDIVIGFRNGLWHL